MKQTRRSFLKFMVAGAVVAAVPLQSVLLPEVLEKKYGVLPGEELDHKTFNIKNMNDLFKEHYGKLAEEIYGRSPLLDMIPKPIQFHGEPLAIPFKEKK